MMMMMMMPDTKEVACNTNPKDAGQKPSNFDHDYETYWFETNGEDIIECDLVNLDDDSDGIEDEQDCAMSQWYEWRFPKQCIEYIGY